MFSFFKKQPEISADNPIVKIFANISKEQKVSIVNLLLVISGGDNGNPQSNELSLLNSYCAMFKVTNNDTNSYLEKFGPPALVKDLSSLSESQKDMLIVIVHEMLMLRKSPSSVKVERAFQILDSIGISQEKYINTIKKGQALTKHMLG